MASPRPARSKEAGISQLRQSSARWRVLPILHLNGYKISDQRAGARRRRPEGLYVGRLQAYFVEATIRSRAQLLAQALKILAEIRAIQQEARKKASRSSRLAHDHIRTPRMDLPKEVDESHEGTFRAHSSARIGQRQS